MVGNMIIGEKFSESTQKKKKKKKHDWLQR